LALGQGLCWSNPAEFRCDRLNSLPLFEPSEGIDRKSIPNLKLEAEMPPELSSFIWLYFRIILIRFDEQTILHSFITLKILKILGRLTRAE
jgi:hypothetical protein